MAGEAKIKSTVMSVYTEEKFLEDVKTEAIALKKNATRDEVLRLEADVINPFFYKECIYGLMTGDCFSLRASDLIFQCCPRYFLSDVEDSRISVIDSDNKKEMPAVLKYVNGSEVEGVTSAGLLCDSRLHDVQTHYSALEVYISIKGAKIHELIAFLRDETKTLEL